MRGARGYFGIGVEGINKAYNAGNLVRSAHAFGASFFYTIAPDVDMDQMSIADTADSFDHMPYFEYPDMESFELPRHCQLVGVELVEDSVELPSFRHPLSAAYLLGPEMGSVSPELLEVCDHIIKIPMKFCINVGVAGAVVMYDRLLSMGKFADRPVRPGGPEEMYKPLQSVHRRKVRSKKT